MESTGATWRQSELSADKLPPRSTTETYNSIVGNRDHDRIDQSTLFIRVTLSQQTNTDADGTIDRSARVCKHNS